KASLQRPAPISATAGTAPITCPRSITFRCRPLRASAMRRLITQRSRMNAVSDRPADAPGSFSSRLEKTLREGDAYETLDDINPRPASAQRHHPAGAHRGRKAAVISLLV